MDLSVVKEKLHSLQYTSVVDFLKDIRLMLNNCKTFNKVQNRFFFSIRQVNRGGNQTADVEKLSLSNCPLWIRQTCLLQALFDLITHLIDLYLAPVVRMSDNAFHWINRCPVNSAEHFAIIYSLESNLSVRQCYLPFIQLGPGGQ